MRWVFFLVNGVKVGLFPFSLIIQDGMFHVNFLGISVKKYIVEIKYIENKINILAKKETHVT